MTLDCWKIKLAIVNIFLLNNLWMIFIEQLEDFKLMKKKYTVMDNILLPLKFCPFVAIAIALFDILLGVVPTIQTLVVAEFLDIAIKLLTKEAEFSEVLFLVVVIVLLIATMWLSKCLKELLVAKLELELRKTFRVKITEKREKLKYYYIEDSKTWDLISRISEKPETRLKDAYVNFLDFFALILQVVGLMIVFVTQIWQISLVMFIVVIPLFIISLKSGKENYLVKQETQKYHRRHEYLGDLLINRDAAQERVLFDYGNGLSKMWHRYYEKARKIELKKQLVWFIRSKMGGVITTCISTIVSLFLTAAVFTGGLTIGMFISLVNSMYSLVDSMVWSLVKYVEQIADNREYMKDFTKFINLEEIEEETKKQKGNIEFESLELCDLKFKYPNTDNYILNGFSFKFEKGNNYAIVGANGAGKTTLIKLLTGLYDTYEGEILLNGRDINEYNKEDVKNIFSSVFQDYAKYSLSIKDNIKVGNLSRYDDIQESELNEIVSNVGLDELISKYSDGIDTKLGKIYDKGQDISGGQWQRIALARAMVRDSQLCILDEPTSALDPISESNLYSEFKNISEGKTLILISHRLGSTKIADKILVIDKGKLAEEGTHKQLIEKNGIYADMYESQRSWYDEE